MSIASTRRAACNVCAASPSTGRASPAPNTASITSSARAASAGSNARTGPVQDLAAVAASVSGRGLANAATVTGQPRWASSRATT